MPADKAAAGKMQDELGVYYCVRKQGSAKTFQKREKGRKMEA